MSFKIEGHIMRSILIYGKERDGEVCFHPHITQLRIRLLFLTCVEILSFSDEFKFNTLILLKNL